MLTKPIVVVQGGQWGSEAKGAIAANLCVTRNIDFAVRTGAINAGHTVAYKGKRYAMQQLPTGWVNPNTRLVIGAGAYIHLETLIREVEMVNAAMPEQDVRDRLWIDRRCGTHTEAAEAASKLANRHHRMGATGKGCSEAIVAKIRDRNDGYKLFIDTLADRDGYRFTDTVAMLNKMYDDGASILIEGTQGTLLDLHLGPYPFTTSRMTSAANWIAECGLSPALQYEVVLVCRTYPIRVAGNSGPMSNEIEWVDLAQSINHKLIASGGTGKISSIALGEFENKLQDAAYKAVEDGTYKVPRAPNRHGYDVRLSDWTEAERSEYRVAASELHRDALRLCSPQTLSELSKFFEMTTVTRKLRRIAELSIDDLGFAIAVNRPAWIALTFIDYVEPELADITAATVGKVRVSTLDRVGNYIGHIEARLGVDVGQISTGPGEGCILPWPGIGMGDGH